MAINKDIIRGIGICIAISAFIALQYGLLVKPSPCESQCMKLAMESDIMTCSMKCKEEAIFPKKKFILISVIVLCGFLMVSQVLDEIFIHKDPKYLNIVDNVRVLIKKTFKRKYVWHSLVDEESLYVPLFES